MVSPIYHLEDPPLSSLNDMPVLDSPDFGHVFVPIDSLTSSPRSSTGSTSVLEWNSNSGSEGFGSVHSLGQERYNSNPPTPRIPPQTGLLPNPPSLNSSPSQLFPSFMSTAPIVDSVSNTATSDTFADDYRHLLGALEERLALQDSVTQWQNYSYRQTAGLDKPETPLVIERPDSVVHDKQQNSVAPSPDRSVVTDSSISAATATPSLHVSSLFLPPAPPTVPSAVSDRSESKSISIAQYFQLKAAKVDDAEPGQPPVDGPTRPISAASCLSYASAESPVQSPATIPVLDRAMKPLSLNETWNDLILKVGEDSSSTTAHPPSESSTRRPRPQCSYAYPESLPHQVCGERTYSPHISPSTIQSCFLYPHSSSSRKSQMETNNIGSQFNSLPIKVNTPSSQGTLKSRALSRAAQPVPPIISSQFEVATPSLKPIKPFVSNNPYPPNIHGRQPPDVTSPYDSFYGKFLKRVNCQAPLQAPTSVYTNFNCQLPSPPTLSCQIPWSNKARTSDTGQVSPGSTDLGLPRRKLSTVPSVSERWPSPTPSGSVISASGIPPSPPQVDSQPGYLRHATTRSESHGRPSHLPFVPPVPSPSPAPALNGTYTSTQRVARALPIPSVPKPYGTYIQTQTPYTPRYTGSTLPRDINLRAGPPTLGPTPRRLRFAPLPPTPSTGFPYTIPSSYPTPLPPYPLYPLVYPYQTPAPHISPPVSAPYPSWRHGGINSPQYWAPHPLFWYSDGSIVFHIENVGYKVHRHFFERHSTYFRDLLAHPTYTVTSPSPHNIFLSDVKKVDFERLLLIFYPTNLIDPELFTVDEWTSILTLSDKWNFAQLKTLATRELGYITTTIEKIALAKKHNIGNPQWLLAAYRELCTRRHPLSLAEGEKLGLETVIKIWEVQHELRTDTGAWGRSVDILIQDKFGLL